MTRWGHLRKLAGGKFGRGLFRNASHLGHKYIIDRTARCKILQIVMLVLNGRLMPFDLQGIILLSKALDPTQLPPSRLEL